MAQLPQPPTQSVHPTHSLGFYSPRYQQLTLFSSTFLLTDTLRAQNGCPIYKMSKQGMEEDRQKSLPSWS